MNGYFDKHVKKKTAQGGLIQIKIERLQFSIKQLFHGRNNMTYLYTQNISVQAQNQLFDDVNVNVIDKSLINKQNSTKNNFAYYNLEQQKDLFADFSKPARGRLFIQLAMYYMVGIGNVKGLSREAIRQYLLKRFGYHISLATFKRRMTELVAKGKISREQQCYFRNGELKNGTNLYTLIKVDPIVHRSRENLQFLVVAQNVSHISSTSSFKEKERRRTNSKDQCFSSDDSLSEKVVKKKRNTNPELLMDPQTWWPNGAAAEVLEEQYGPSYVAQEPIVSEFQSLMEADYPDRLPRRLLNYKFILFAKATKPLKERYGPSYMSFAKRRLYNQTHQHAPKVDFQVYVQKASAERPLESPAITQRTNEEILADIARISTENKEIREVAKKEFIDVHGIPSSLGSPEGTQWRLRLNQYCDHTIEKYRESVKKNE